MARPTSMAIPTNRGRYGLVVGIYPSTNRDVSVELWDSTGATAASTRWAKTWLPPTTANFLRVIELPLSTRYHYAKCRSVGPGYSASTFTATVRAKPAKIPFPLPAVPTLQNRGGNFEVPGFIHVPSSYTMNVGAPSQVSPTTYLEKKLRITHGSFSPDSSGYRVQRTLLYMNPNFNTGTLTVTAAAPLPPGVLVTGLSARVYRATSASSANAFFYRIAGDTATLISFGAFGSGTTAGWRTITDTFATSSIESVTSTRSYTVVALLRTTIGASVDNVRIQYAELTYRMPRYDRAY
jgi:hypothetical protein